MPDSLPRNIVTTVADVKGVEPTNMKYALQEHVDTDALEQLAEHDDATWHLSLELPEHDVTVTSEGRIFVDGELEDTWA